MIILIVGGVGIANVMLMAVGERTREIGLRKAFGATNRDIQRQFMLESVCISLLGGLPGVAAGLLKSSYMFTAKQAGFLLLPVLVGLAFALAVGVLAGYYPASQAAKMEPVVAINAD